jgi:flagellar L-ring protein precursor FlgH
MKTICIIFAIAFFSTLNCSYAQFTQNTSRSLFSDVKAYREGDAVTILIVEDTEAGNSASTSQDRSSALSGSLEMNTGGSSTSPGIGINSGNKFSGSGSTSRKESIRSKLSARIVEVDDNGNLSIEGKRTTKINGENQTIIIRGYVRPVDVTPNNSVYSYSILDLSLTIEGDGAVSKTQEPGLITKFLRFLF